MFLLGLAVAFPFGGLLVGAFGPKAAYALAGVGAAISGVDAPRLASEEPGAAEAAADHLALPATASPC